MIASVIFGASMVSCSIISILFLIAIHTMHAYLAAVISFTVLYGIVSLIIETYILCRYDKVHDWDFLHRPTPPVIRAFLVFLWIILMIFIRFLRETAPQSVGFFCSLALAVFFATRLIRPTRFDSGFFTFCCVSTAAQSFMAFGVSLPTWLLVIFVLALHLIDYIMIARDTDAAQAVERLRIESAAEARMLELFLHAQDTG